MISADHVQMAHLSPETRRQLTRDNAAALYGL